MKRFKHIALLLPIALLGAGLVHAETAVFVNVNVVPMSSERILGAQTVLIEDGVITAIGDVDAVRIPEGATVVDGTDRYLMPGLGEMHAHVPAADSGNIDRDFTLFIANGVTTIRGMLGRPSHLALRQQLENGEVFGPRLFTSGPSLNGRSVDGTDDARRQVREQAAAGYDFVKIHPGLDADEFTAIAETANKLGMPFAGHVPVAVGVVEALRQGIATIDHLDGYLAALLPRDSHGSGGYGGFFDILLAAELDPGKIDDIVAATAASGTWNVPTQTLIEHRASATPVSELQGRPEMKCMPAATVRRWTQSRQSLQGERGFDPDVAELAIKLRRRLIFALYEAGAGLLLGSDAPQVFNVPGFSLHSELELLVASGLTPFEALRTGTTAVAEFLETDGGSVEAGKLADLVLLDADPLEDVGNTRRIHGVMLRGQWLAAADLQDRLDRYCRSDGD